jgi:hypothetical protein
MVMLILRLQVMWHRDGALQVMQMLMVLQVGYGDRDGGQCGDGDGDGRSQVMKGWRTSVKGGSEKAAGEEALVLSPDLQVCMRGALVTLAIGKADRNVARGVARKDRKAVFR